MVQYCCDHYAQLYPADTIQPVFMPFADAFKGVRDGLVDIAICARPGAGDSAGLSSSTLYATRMGALVAVGNPLAQQAAISRGDLASHEVVMHSMWCPPEDVQAWASESPVPFAVRLTSGGTEAMQETCARGGIYLYPETDAGEFPYTFVPLEEPIASYSTLVYPTAPQPAALDFVKSTLEYLAPYTDRRDLRMLVDWSTRPA